MYNTLTILGMKVFYNKLKDIDDFQRSVNTSSKYRKRNSLINRLYLTTNKKYISDNFSLHNRFFNVEIPMGFESC